MLKLEQNQRRYLLWALCHNPPSNIFFKLPHPETYSERKDRKRNEKRNANEQMNYNFNIVKEKASQYGFDKFLEHDFTFKAITRW